MRGFCVWLVSTRTSLLACSHPRSLLPGPGLTSERRSWGSSVRAGQRKKRARYAKSVHRERVTGGLVSRQALVGANSSSIVVSSPIPLGGPAPP
jgi:hypothetical protein